MEYCVLVPYSPSTTDNWLSSPHRTCQFLLNVHIITYSLRKKLSNCQYLFKLETCDAPCTHAIYASFKRPYFPAHANIPNHFTSSNNKVTKSSVHTNGYRHLCMCVCVYACLCMFFVSLWGWKLFFCCSLIALHRLHKLTDTYTSSKIYWKRCPCVSLQAFKMQKRARLINAKKFKYVHFYILTEPIAFIKHCIWNQLLLVPVTFSYHATKTIDELKNRCQSVLLLLSSLSLNSKRRNNGSIFSALFLV